MDILYTSVGDA